MNDEMREFLRKMSEDPQVARFLAGRNLEKMLTSDPRSLAVLESLSGSGPEEAEKFAQKMMNGPQGEMLRQMFGNNPKKP